MEADPSALVERLQSAVARVVAGITGEDVGVALERMDSGQVLAMLADAAVVRDAVDVILATGSAVVARRSARNRGYAGLAQQKGHRNATSLVQSITGQSRGDVTRAVRAGEDLLGGAAPVAAPPSGTGDDGRSQTSPPAVGADTWLERLRGALAAGRISQAQFHAIRGGLGEPPVERYPDLDPEFLPAAWGEAVDLLLAEADECPVEELRVAARIARDRLDPVGVTLRFEERFAARSFRTWIDEDGQHHAKLVFDDEAAAWVQAMLHAALRPRRGPRFVPSDDAARAKTIVADERSNEQLQYDTLIAVLRAGAAAEPGTAFGDRQPGVRIIIDHTAIEACDTRGEAAVVGVGHVEHSGEAVPGGVVEKFLCDAGALPVTVDSCGRPLDVGREERLFTRKQRIAIAARDGGCVWTGCGAPIDWCEYHHIDHWWEDHGRTDVDDGVPLCRTCHLRLHNQKWRITRERDPVTGVDTYYLHAPPDPVTGLIADPMPLRTKSPRRFRAA